MERARSSNWEGGIDRILVRELEGKRIPRHSWKDNIKKDLRNVGWVGHIWTE
jgi:hypothetical protein